MYFLINPLSSSYLSAFLSMIFFEDFPSFISSPLPRSGVVFPYSPSVGRYNLNYVEATKACLHQNASVANLDQLRQAWKGGLDWCNAGWLSDGTVHYPVVRARGPCGGNKGPGLISYGTRNKQNSRYDVFCFATALKGGLLLFVLYS